MVKRYLGAVLVAFVLGGVGPLTVAAAQAAEEPDEAPSPLGSVTETLGGLTSTDTGTAPDDDSSGSAGVLGAVTTAVNRLADAPRSLLADVAGGEVSTPDVPARPDVSKPDVSTPDVPERPDVPKPDVPKPDAPEPPADTPTRPNEPEAPNANGPKKPETPARPPADTPAGPPANPDSPAGLPTNVAPVLPDVDQSGVTESEQTGPARAQQSITRPDTAEPDRVTSQRPRQDVPTFPDPTNASGDNPAGQDKSAARPPQDVRAELISLRHVTQTPFVLAIALLTAVGVVTVRRVITVK